MDYKSFKDIIVSRRSVRKFKNEPVSKEVINELIDCARWAPSDTNQQPWKFIAISNKDMIEGIAKVAEDAMERLKKKADAIERPDVKKKIEVFGRYALVFRNAPVVLVCLAEPYESRFTEEVFKPLGLNQQIYKDEGLKSASLASQNILLAAHAMGYGACAMSAPMILAEEELKEFFKIEEKYMIALIIALGKPELTPGAPPRKSVDDIVEYID